MLSEEIRVHTQEVKEASAENANTLIKMYRMLIEREIMLVTEMTHIKVTRSILRESMRDIGMDTTKLED